MPPQRNGSLAALPCRYPVHWAPQIGHPPHTRPITRRRQPHLFSPLHDRSIWTFARYQVLAESTPIGANIPSRFLDRPPLRRPILLANLPSELDRDCALSRDDARCQAEPIIKTIFYVLRYDGRLSQNGSVELPSLSGFASVSYGHGSTVVLQGDRVEATHAASTIGISRTMINTLGSAADSTDVIRVVLADR